MYECMYMCINIFECLLRAETVTLTDISLRLTQSHRSYFIDAESESER